MWVGRLYSEIKIHYLVYIFNLNLVVCSYKVQNIIIFYTFIINLFPVYMIISITVSPNSDEYKNIYLVWIR